ncbi:MAG: terminase gpA endonuclease subunit [Gammaproteobacteria bacterium]
MNRILPPGSAEPGRWRSSRTPYLIDIMRAAVDPRYRRVVAVMGSQMGKTELLLNLIGHRLDVDPAPVLFIGASQRQVEQISTTRVSRLIRSTPSLDAKLDKRRNVNKVTEKSIAGQPLRFAWAGSAIELSSTPAALVLLDERDRMEDVAGEGDALALAEARTATYPDGKVVATSTPTLEGASPIWSLFEGGTQARWAWACPDCQGYFVPSFALLKWPDKASPSVAKREARLACPSCGSLIADRHRGAMNATGRYEFSGDLDSDCASFWVSGLCSPWRSWGDAARGFVEAAKSKEPGRVQAVMNTTFGELFRLQGEAPEVSKVGALRGAYKFDEVPDEAQLLTCGVDVQKDRLFYAIRAWGAAATSWLLRHGELWGETDQQGVWSDLAALLSEEWGGRRIRLMLVDSGYRPDAAYEFARRFPGRVLPAKGHDQQARPVFVSKLQVSVTGKTSRRGVSLAHVDAGYMKSFVHGRIVWPLDQPGAWHLAADTTDDYCEQIVSESRVAKANGTIIWVRSKKANHYLDCEGLNCAAAHLLNVHVLKRRAVRQQKATDEAEVTSAPITPPRTRATGPFSGTRRPAWVRRW